MSIDTSVPGYPELYDWPQPVTLPLRIRSHGAYRDSGPQGPTYYVDLEDAAGHALPFFFDRFLGRLCYGSSYESGSDAAFLKAGSKIEREAISAIEALAASSEEFQVLLAKVRHAKTWIAQE